jgi:hypothetical protein
MASIKEQILNHIQTHLQNDSRPQRHLSEHFHSYGINGRFPSSLRFKNGSLDNLCLSFHHIDTYTSSLPDNLCACHETRQSTRAQVILKM